MIQGIGFDDTFKTDNRIQSIVSKAKDGLKF